MQLRKKIQRYLLFIIITSLFLNPNSLFSYKNQSNIAIAEESEPEIIIHNVQSYPHVGGYWTVSFSVNGTADLIITAVDGTILNKKDCMTCDLLFENIINETDTKFDIIWEKDSIVIKNFSSDTTVYETSKVITSGKHKLKFTFGDDIVYAFNDATNWWDSDWSYRKLVTIDHDQVAGNLVNFPVLINITDSNLGDEAQSTGNDIAFISYSDNSTQYAHEIENYDNSDGSLIVWINITSISSTADTSFWMYYGNNGCENQEDPTDVWDSNFLMIQHLEESDIDGGNGDITDSTSNNNDGTTSGMDPSDDVNAKIGTGFDLDGINDYIDTTNNLFTKPGMICLWFKTSNAYGGIYGMQDVDVGGGPSWYVPIINIDNNILQGSWGWYSNSKPQLQTSQSVTDNAWHYVCLGYDLTYDYLYLDGNLVDSSAIATGNVVFNTYQQVGVLRGGWGSLPEGWLYFDGTLDEVRISNTVRSSSWISTSYNNMNNQSTFVSVGSEDEYVSISITNSEGTTTYTQYHYPVIIDSAIIISGTEGNPEASVQITSGYIQGQDILSGGGGSWDSTAGKLTITDASDWSDLQTKLRSVTFYTTSLDTSNRVIAFTIGESLGDSLYYEGTDHYYEFVSSSGISWTDAESAAESKSYTGLAGYLATVTSQGENDFIYSKLSGDGWMGASDASSESDWYWVTGPEAGTKFFDQTSASSNSGNLYTVYGGNTPGGGNAVSGFYNNWASGEPNDWSASGEDYGHFYSAWGTWNDYAATTSVAGYVVEYGGEGYGGNASEGSSMDTKTIEIEESNGIWLTEETVENEQEEVSPDLSEFSVNITHRVGGEFHWWINTTPYIGNASGISNNPYEIGTCYFSGLQPFTRYEVKVTIIGSNHTQYYNFTTGGNIGDSSWHNSSTLNVTVEHQYPRILWYDIQKYTGTTTENDRYLPTTTNNNDWTSIRNNMTEVDNATWLRVILNISSDQGWDNIEYINITGWHDNGTLETGTDYNTTGNHGSNRNFFLSYDNTSDNIAYYNKTWPRGCMELTKGNYTENNVTDTLGIITTETHNLTFQFKPGYQFRYAPGPDSTGNTWTNHTVTNTNGYPTTNGAKLDYHTTQWEALNNTWSWNLNISITNKGQRSNGGTYTDGPYTTWILDEFGTYTYTEIVSAGGNINIQGAPGANYSTNSTNPFNSGTSQNITIQTRSNGNYSLTVHIDDLLHTAANTLGYNRTTAPNYLILENDTIWIQGGTRTTPINFSDANSRYWINLYGTCNTTTGQTTTYEQHETNGTSKYTGETAEDDESNGNLYPNDYNQTTDPDNNLRAYNSQNTISHYIEYTCQIPLGTWAGTYSTHVYYHLQTQE